MGLSDGMKTGDVRPAILLAGGGWTLILLLSLVWHYFETKKDLLNVAHQTARESVRKDLLYRRWAAEHGGVYVPATDKSPPNPNLSHLPERDIVTPSGRKLTLVNPAYMTRQVHELARDRGEQTGHLVSITPRNPKNTPDEWETRALRTMEKADGDVSGIDAVNGEEFYRLVRPMPVGEPCLKCHADQGYLVGELRGGISVSVPMKPIRAMIREQLTADLARLSVIWLAGLAAIGFAGRLLRRRVAERELATEALRASEERFRTMVNTSLEGVVTVDDLGTVTFLNARMAELLGRDENEVLGHPLAEFVVEEERVDVAERLARRRTGLAEQFEQTFLHRDGSGVATLASAAPLMDANGRFRGVCGMFTDITARKRTDEALRESERRTRNIIESLPIGMHIYRFDSDGRLVFAGANPAADRILGLDNRSLIGNTIEEAFPSLKETDIPERYRAVATTGEGWHTEKVSYQDREISGVYDVYAFRSEPQTVAVAFQDITAQRRTQEALRESEERYRSLFDQAGDYTLILTAGEDGIPRIVDMNESALRAHGYGREELIGRPITVLELYPENNPNEEVNARLAAHGEALFTVRHRRKDGSWFDAEIHAKVVEIGGEKFIVSVERDVTDRRRAEDALRESEERWRTIVENEPECVKLLDREGRLLEMNPAGLAMIEARLDQVKGGKVVTLVAEEHRAPFQEMIDAVFRGESRRLVFDLIGLQGRRRTMETTSVPLRDPTNSGAVTALLGVTRDISERRLLEEQLIQAQKMEAIGQLAGGVAHDFNNLIQAISTFNYVIKLQLQEISQPVQLVEEQQTVIRRAAELTGALLAFSRRQVMNPRVQDLNRIVRDARKLLRRIISEDIAIEVRQSPAELAVCVDEGQIQQVLINLATNARDAMPKGGRLVIGTSRFAPDGAFQERYSCKATDTFALVSVADTGSGIAKESLSHIFEPFFTTKSAGRGTGLGLAIVYGIVRQHQGIIEVDSHPGDGTVFRLYFPLIAASATADVIDAVSVPQGGNETILLVEDEGTVRLAMKTILSSFGYDVVEAVNGEEAVDLFRERSGTIHLVIMDIVMPKMNGPEALEKIRQLSPGVRSILLSGYEKEVLEQKGINGWTDLLLMKPVEPNALLEAIRRALEGECCG